MAGVGKLNALEIEMEMMDPVDYWSMHRRGWHTAGDMAGYCHYPNLAGFYYDLEQDAEWLLDQVFGASLN